MALDKLTIIDGGGLSTTSDYRVGVITATKFVGPVEGSITATDATFSGNVSIAGTLTYEDVTNVDSVGIITARNGIKVSTGTATTALVVDGDARVTGILTVGTGSLTLDGPNNLVNVGTALTLGHTQGLQFHTQNLHSAGFEVNQINVSGVSTFSGNVDVNANIHGRNLILDGNNGIKYIDADLANGNSISLRGYIGSSYHHLADFIRGGACGLNFSGNRKLETSNTGVTVTGTVVATGADINGDIDVDGHTNLDNVSIAGVSTFSGGINCTTDGVGKGINIGASQDLIIQHNGTNSFIDNNTGDLYIQTTGSGDDILVESADDFTVKVAGSETAIQADGDGAVRLYHNGSQKMLTSTTGINVGFRIAASGDENTYVNLGSPADQWQFHTGGVDRLFITGGPSDDGTVQIRGDNNKLQIGASQDLQLFHDGSHSRLYSATGMFNIQSDDFRVTDAANSLTAFKIDPDGATDLRYNGSVKLQTTSAGVQVTGNLDLPDNTSGNASLRLGNSQDFFMNHNGTHSYIINNTGNLYIRDLNGDVHIQGKDAEESIIAKADGAVELYYNNGKRIETTAYGVKVTGAGPNNPTTDSWDTNSSIITSGSYGGGIAMIDGSRGFVQYLHGGGVNWELKNAATNSTPETNIKAIANGAVELFHNDAKKLETATYGVAVTGQLVADNGLKVNDGNHITLGTDNDLRLYFDGSNAAWNNQTGNSYFYGGGGNFYFRPVNAEQALNIHANGSIELFHDNVKTLETLNEGIKIHTGSTSTVIRISSNTDVESIIQGYNSDLLIKSPSGGNITLYANGTESAVNCIANGAVELFYDSGTYGTAKLQTTTTGIKINGDSGGLALNVQNGYIRSVGGTPTVVAHKSSSTFCHIGVEGNTNARAFLAYTNDKDFIIGRRTAYTGDHTGYSGADITIDKTNHAVVLYYNGGSRLNTTSGGVNVTGNLECDGITSSGGMATTSGYINLQGTATNKLLLQGADGQLIRYRNAASTYVASITSIGNGDTFQLLNEKQSQYLNIETGGVRIGGRLTLPTTDTGITFGPGSTNNDRAHIEWKGGDNAGYLRISTDDDSDAGVYEYIEFGDYATDNRGGAFTQHCRIKRDEFLIKTGGPSGTENRLKVDQGGVTHVYGDIYMNGSATTTNQSRKIYWTGFDKEGTSDLSDTAEIRHTINVHGIAGSVLELKADNDANDGIALNASSGNGQIALNGKIRGNIEMHDYGGRIRPSYGTGDKGIYWQPDPAGGSGDYAHIQYYTDGSGEDTRLRIQIANDSQDDLRLEGPVIRAEGSFSSTNKHFRIPHVLSGLTTTTDLIHSVVEGPQADNLYRGRTTLVAGISTVNIDTTNNMTEGTFVNLNRDVQCFTTNETGWTAIKGSVTGNLLTIVAQDNTCTDTISWMVIGERWDLAMYDPYNPMTDANGKAKTEIPNDSYNKGGDYEQDYISQNRLRVGISTFFRPSIENKEVE